MLEFRSTNAAHQPVIEALGLIARYAKAGNLTYYPAGETAPEHSGTAGDWADLVHRTDSSGRRRVVRMVYEVATFQALREQLRCKEIWVVGAGRWRNPDEDLPEGLRGPPRRALRAAPQAAGPGRVHRRAARGDDRGAGRARRRAARPGLAGDHRAHAPGRSG